MEKCYIIQDQKTGRFLSWMSISDGETENTYSYITYTGKLGTDFYSTIESAEKEFIMLKKRNKKCKLGKSLCIADLDEDELDELPVGETFIEHINVINPEENKVYTYARY